VGLLVDKGNPQAEHLYHDVGFRHVGDSTWGGHEMKHLQFILNKT
jgi:DNA-3-methyladenine glycosylase I